MFFRFPPDTRWNEEQSTVEFSIDIGEYDGVVRVGRRVFQALLNHTPTPERCLEAYHLQRTRLELIAERKVRCRQLTDLTCLAATTGVAMVPLYAARVSDLRAGRFRPCRVHLRARRDDPGIASTQGLRLGQDERIDLTR